MDQQMGGVGIGEELCPHALPAGAILNGRYILFRPLGQGGFGITYAAKDDQTGEKVAIKEFFPETMATRSGSHSVIPFAGQRQENFAYGMQCFLSEAQTLAQFIGEENIVGIHSYFEENGTAYFVMDYVEGISLQTYIKNQGGRIPWEEAKRILFPVMDAMSIVHSKGIIHRDIAPDNIYITKDGQVKLLDFGAARYSLGDRSRSLDVVLKVGYAPKEQYSRRGRQGPYTDIYSLAATFYYALTGRTPPESIERLEEDDLVLPSSMRIRIPEEAEAALEKALSVQPADRFASMAAFKEALDVQEEIALPVEPESRPEPVSVPVAEAEAAPKGKAFPRKPLLAGVLLAVLGVGGILIFGIRENPRQIPQTQPVLASEPEQTVMEDPQAVLKEQQYQAALRLLESGDYQQAYAAFEALGDYLDSLEMCKEARYREAASLKESGAYRSAYKLFKPLDGYRDSREQVRQIVGALIQVQTIDADMGHTACLKTDGTVVFKGHNWSGQGDVRDWTDIVAISTARSDTIGVRSDGTIVTAGNHGANNTRTAEKANAFHDEISGWTDIVSVFADSYWIVGLRSDGTVVVTGVQDSIRQQMSQWRDIIAVSEFSGGIIGLCADGTVVAAGRQDGQESYDFSGWTDIVALESGIGVRADGTLAMMEENEQMAQWTDIVSVAIGFGHVVGLRRDGTVVAAGSNWHGEGKVSQWKDIVAIAAGADYTVGLRSDGSIVGVGLGHYDIRWRDIRMPTPAGELLR